MHRARMATGVIKAAIGENFKAWYPNSNARTVMMCSITGDGLLTDYNDSGVGAAFNCTGVIVLLGLIAYEFIAPSRAFNTPKLGLFLVDQLAQRESELTRVICALGTNLGDRVSYLREALTALNHVVAQSSVYESEALGGPAGQGKYLNMVIAVDTNLDVHSFHQKCLAIESSAGRQRRIKWEARTLDIDILFYGNESIQSDTLTIPHPLIKERLFVMAPLAEICPTQVAPNWEKSFAHSTINRLGCLSKL